MSSDDTLARDSFRSASSLMGLQLFSRLFTFILNQAMFRMAPPRAYGTAAIQFELLLSTILFLSREGVRNALLRGTKAKTDPAIRNLSVLPIFIGFPLAVATACGYAHFAGHDVRSQAHFTSSIGVYALAALLELMSEPMHNLAMAELRTGVRVRAEGLGITTKTVVTFLVLLYDLRRGGEGTLALIAFAGGQLAYGAAVLATYVAAYGAGHIWITRPPIASAGKPSHYFDPETLRLSLTMTSQSIIKHFLTEGDKLILSWFSPLQDQGGYAVAVNYGSLVARIVFQPIEEASRGFFSKVLGGGSTSKDKTSHAELEQAATALVSLMSVQAAFSVVLLVFGTAYIPILLQVLLPRQYLATSAPQVLSAWVWYIPVLAFNGALEAFLSSVATPRDLNIQSRWMAVFSAVYILASVSFFNLHLGDASLVYANILNLSVRIIYSATFVSAFYARLGARQLLHWKSVLPGAQLLFCAATSAVLIRASSKVLKVDGIINGAGQISLTQTSVLLHIAVGGALGLTSVGTWWITSGRYLSLPRTRHIKSQ
ncbi:hypothetical protein DXG03_004212 [Asterophora parasitica]|uniref:Man(5)GlcNAc(2)-PP-dolichol translocation protein RFT1 n=1 Tax=Asterophora parasitica TaxID=117018 RepID=A0A9P7GAV8_9AGAR|nr:hypothetical protein DXG03_004212 [Asterophora parasitica]